MSSYVLAEAAAADLREIGSFSRRQWGAAQAHSYLAKLEQAIERLAAGDAPFSDMGSLYPSLRMIRCERHHIFCRLRDDAPMLVVAVFHERMDMIARLTRRLAEAGSSQTGAGNAR